MTDQTIIQIIRDAFYNVVIIVGPLLLVSLIVGLVISIFQAATTISEQTLTFVPKLIAVFLVTVLLMPYMISTLTDFTKELFNMIAQMGPNY
ncbi:flagellar biosynthesis protein FliQ [Candidatus Kapabacteria bacterium]|nr:flagellar biosynthesis protein FliQ [Candidatus Kapabacteria bacterium]